jgi:DNA-binding MarR family transcriptional regulator
LFDKKSAVNPGNVVCTAGLAKYIHKTTGNITTVIDNLEKQGLVNGSD